ARADERMTTGAAFRLREASLGIPCAGPDGAMAWGSREMDDRGGHAALAASSLAGQLLEGLPDALVVADVEGVIRFWNAGAERIFGFPAAEALGRPLDIIIPENLRARHNSGYEQTMR